MSSEFTLDIQLTELGFSSWDFPICEPQSVKETVLPTQTSIEKSLPETQTFTYSNEDASIVPSGSAENSFLQDHQYSSPIKENAGVITKNAENNSETTPTEEKERVIFHNKWKRKRKELGDLKIDDKEQEQSQEKSTNEMDQHSEMSKKTSSLQIDDDDDDDDDDEEEKTDEDTEFDFTEEEDEEEEVEDGDEGDDMSNSEMNGSGENEENYCHVCDVTFPSLFLLREHLNMHAGVRPYRCDECNKQFCQLVNYRAHLRSHSQKASIHCKVCSTVFETEELLQQHLDTNHFENEFYQCDFCKQIFTDLEVCQDHVDKHRQEAKRHLCLKCGSSFRHRNSLLQHLQWHSRGIFSCPDCERTFSSKGSLLRHSFSHLGVLPYTCLKCKRHFRLPSLYRNHECKPEQVQCMACLVFFQSQEDFDKHKKETGCWGHQGALPSKTDEIRCMECGQVCASVEELKKHGSTHQRVLKCAECGMGFRSSLMLMSHMGGHAAQRPCLCKDCGLGFPHQQGYDSHLKTCGLETPPVATAKKPKLKKPPSPKKNKSIASNVRFQCVAQDSSLVKLSQNKVIQTIPLGDQKSTADGVWKFSLNKDHPPGVPLVMLFPVPVTQSLSTSKPDKISQNFLPSSLVLEPPSSGPCVISMPVVPPSPVVCKASEKDMTGQSGTSIPANVLIQMNIDNGSSKNKWTILKNKKSEVGKDAVKPHQGQTVTAQPEEENKQYNLKNEPCALINDEKHGNVNKMSLSSEDCDPSSVTADGGVPLNIIGESSVISSSLVSQIELKKSSKNQRFCKETVSPDSTSVNSSVNMSDLTWTGDNSDNSLQEGYTCDVEVEVDEEIEVEIADEDSGVDMLEGELHECVTCGQVLPEKDMIQHYMKHAAVSDTPCLSSNKCASHTTEQSTSCSPSRKRSDTEL